MTERTKLIEDIIQIEWEMFSGVHNTGGQAECQQDPMMFCAMRVAQMLIWKTVTLESYLMDLLRAQSEGKNLMAEKYARMMRKTHPDEYEQVKKLFALRHREATLLTDQILSFFEQWQTDIGRRYPKVHALGRRGEVSGLGYTSTANYLEGELLTYSVRTLRLCWQDVMEARAQKINLVETILSHIAVLYGYQTLAKWEAKTSG